ncbi:Maf family protein [Anderseniella sp. Alg231-50]|uniref:Maf family protein n=1 Tax=Anderseniella sp. Alg231-50 TaxID=1922226 RepID=UPI000D55FE87
MKLILASNSAARRQMLANAGYDFEATAAGIDEAVLKTAHLESGLPVDDLALVLANAKAQAVSENHPADLVIGSDQVLVCDGKVFTKVNDLPQAAQQLATLQGKTHMLMSAVACWRNSRQVFETSETASMSMFRLTAEDIEAYLAAAGSSILGSVGCYQIEGQGIRLFEDIRGSHFTIMGMPLTPLVKFLKTQANLQ